MKKFLFLSISLVKKRHKETILQMNNETFTVYGKYICKEVMGMIWYKWYSVYSLCMFQNIVESKTV